MEGPGPPPELRVGVRAAQRMKLANEAVRAMGTMKPTPGLIRSASLIRSGAWAPRTVNSRSSQWKAWVAFCDDEKRSYLPVNEAQFLAFFCWVTIQREQGKRSLSTASLKQYMSSVRQMQLMSLRFPVPTFPLVQAAERA